MPADSWAQEAPSLRHGERHVVPGQEMSQRVDLAFVHKGSFVGEQLFFLPVLLRKSELELRKRGSSQT